MDRELIAQYAAGPTTLRQAIAGLSDEQILAHPIPGKWSIQELVIHVVDADFVGMDRMKRVIAEDNPRLLAFDENRWLERLHPSEQSVADSLVLFETGRRQMVRILERLPDEAFARTGEHSERGPLSLETLVQTFVNHLAHHLKFVAEKRAKLA